MDTLTFLVVVALAGALVARELSWRRRVGRLRSELRRARARGLEHEQLANVGQFISSLAQELKGPLQGVIGNTELMLASTTPDPSSAEDLRGIQENVTRAADIFRSLLAFTETTTLSRRWQDVNDIVNRAADGCRGEFQAAGAQLSVNTAERLPLVYVDGRQLDKVVATLMSRRWPRSAAGGEAVAVAVTTRLSDPDGRIVVEVCDPTAAVLPGDGSWSGDLAACRQIVEAHAGTLEVKQPPNGGFRFLLELPVSAGGADAADAGQP